MLFGMLEVHCLVSGGTSGARNFALLQLMAQTGIRCGYGQVAAGPRRAAPNGNGFPLLVAKQTVRNDPDAKAGAYL